MAAARSRRRWTDKEDDWLEALIEEGLSIRETAERMGRSEASIHCRCVTLGLSRGRGRQRHATASYTAGQYLAFHRAFVGAMERAGYVHFHHAGPKDVAVPARGPRFVP